MEAQLVKRQAPFGSNAHSWLLNFEALSELCQDIKNSTLEQINTQVDGRTIIQSCNKKLRILRRDGYDELWELLNELNFRSNRRTDESPITKNREFGNENELQCGWYTNRVYLIVGQKGVGKTAFLLSTLIFRIHANKPTIIQTDKGNVFLIDNYKVQKLDGGGKVALESVLKHYKMNRNLWVLCDDATSVLLPQLLNNNWVRVHTSSKNIRCVQGCKSTVRLFIDNWSFGEVAFIGNHIIKYSPSQLRRAVILYQCFDPSGRLSLCSKLVKDGNACENYMAQMRQWLPQEVQRLLNEESSIVPLIVQRPCNKRDLGLEYVGTRMQYQIATRFTSDNIVSAAFQLGLPKLQAWVRDLDTQTAFQNSLVESLIQRRLKSGGLFKLESGSRLIVKPSELECLPEDTSSFVINRNNNNRCKASVLNKYVQFYSHRDMGIAVVNEKDGPRLVCFYANNTTESNDELLADLWRAMPEEVTYKTPWLVNVVVNDEDFTDIAHSPMIPTNSSHSSLISETALKIASTFQCQKLILDKQNLYTGPDAFPLRLRFQLTTWRIKRFFNYITDI